MIKPQRWECVWIEPLIIAKAIVNDWGEEGLIWLDGDGSSLGRWSTLAIDPIEEISCNGLPKSPNSHNPFQALRKLSPGHWTGWLSYEAAAWIEYSNLWKPDPMATLWLAKHDPVIHFDNIKHQLWIEGCNLKKMEELKSWITSLRSNNSTIKYLQNTLKTISIPYESWEQLKNKDDYAKDVKKLQEWIKKGDIFQGNLTTCFKNKIPINLLNIDLFIKLRNHCKAPFAGLIITKDKANGQAIISASPERFIKLSSKGEVETRPIKGTRPRHQDLIKDAESAADLVSSSKDRAENIMIVDLLRNDLGKVCSIGSIKTPQIVGLESFPHVHHLTSVITGKLNQKNNWVDLLEACWPGGSISGAPKLRACQRLNELETTSRGPYCGSLLRKHWNGSIDSNILIRSIFRQNTTLRAHAGCGIIADSDAFKEAEELTWKIIPMLKALE